MNVALDVLHVVVVAAAAVVVRVEEHRLEVDGLRGDIGGGGVRVAPYAFRYWIIATPYQRK